MLKKRNAMELPTAVIITAILGLIVLVVLMAIFSKESGRTVSVLGSCETRGGNCNKANCNDDERKIVGVKCEANPNNYPCCVGI